MLVSVSKIATEKLFQSFLSMPDNAAGINTANTAKQVNTKAIIVDIPFVFPNKRSNTPKIIAKIISVSVLKYYPATHS